MEYIVLGLIATFVILLVVAIRSFAFIKTPDGKKARKGKAGAKEALFQDGKNMIPHEDREVWEDDDLYNIKEGADRAAYMGDKKAKKEDAPMESWDNY